MGWHTVILFNIVLQVSGHWVRITINTGCTTVIWLSYCPQPFTPWGPVPHDLGEMYVAGMCTTKHEQSTIRRVQFVHPRENRACTWHNEQADRQECLPCTGFGLSLVFDSAPTSSL